MDIGDRRNATGTLMQGVDIDGLHGLIRRSAMTAKIDELPGLLRRIANDADTDRCVAVCRRWHRHFPTSKYAFLPPECCSAVSFAGTNVPCGNRFAAKRRRTQL